MTLAFYKAILANEPAAGTAYADWLEEAGHLPAAQKVRDLLKWGHLTSFIRRSLLVKVDRLVRSQTAFRAWYSHMSHHPDSHHLQVGLKDALEKGYVPTLSSKRKLQRRLGQYLEILGYKVFWT